MALPETTFCVPDADGTGSKDYDRDGIPAVYAWRGSQVTVHEDGSTTATAHPGWCWLAGDLDDDGSSPAPEGTGDLPEGSFGLADLFGALGLS